MTSAPTDRMIALSALVKKHLMEMSPAFKDTVLEHENILDHLRVHFIAFLAAIVRNDKKSIKNLEKVIRELLSMFDTSVDILVNVNKNTY